MTELKPCPFCGGGAYIHRTDFLNAESVYGVRCCDCESSSSQLYDTELEAIEAWNTRYEPPILVDYVKQGKWELDRSRGWICCTNCHNEMPLRYVPNGTFHIEDFPSSYCPYCGANMKGEDNEINRC